MARALFLTLLALLALLGAVSALNTCPQVAGVDCDGDNGVCLTLESLDQYCACRSGFSGLDCATAVTSCSSSFLDVNATATVAVPTSVTASYVGNALTVVVVSPLVTERNYTTIAIDAAGENKTECGYPGLYWTRDFNACNDEFTGVMPWVATQSCGWVQDTTLTESYTYKADMIISHHDWTEPFGNRTAPSIDRLTQHLVPLTLSFDKYVTVSSNITVQSPVKLLVGISRQIIAPDGNSAMIQVSTNLIWPYYLTSETFTFTPTDYPGMVFAVAEDASQKVCVNDGSSTCTQVFNISITNIAAHPWCYITGAYVMQWTLNCQGGSSTTQCAIDSATNTASAEVDVTSENFCPSVSVDVGITGSMASFDANTYTTSKTNFLVGQTMYFRADVTSVNATLTKVLILSTTITTASGSPVVLYTFNTGTQTPSSLGSAVFTVDAEAASYAEFNFVLDSAYIAFINQDEKRDYTVTAKLQVAFTGVNGIAKRYVLDATLLKQNLAVLNTVEVGAQPTQTDSASSLMLSLTAMAACIVALLF